MAHVIGLGLSLHYQYPDGLIPDGLGRPALSPPRCFGEPPTFR